MQIAAGVHKGRKLATPKGDDIRPTSARARQAIFDILTHGIDGFSLDDIRVIDLFAGTGALGLEALSRGARYCLFVDDNAAARALIRENIETIGLTGHTKIFRRDATSLGPVAPLRPFDLVLMDPPYGLGLGKRALNAILEGGWLNPDAIIVLETRTGTDIAVPEEFELLDQRTHGEAQTLILKLR